MVKMSLYLCMIYNSMIINECLRWSSPLALGAKLNN